MRTFVMVFLKTFLNKEDGWNLYSMYMKLTQDSYKCVCLRKPKSYMGHKVIDDEDTKSL